MKKEISVLGCGWLGFPLAIKLVGKGYSVKGSTTSENKLLMLKSNGITPFQIHLNSKLDVSKFLSSEILIINIPSKNISDFDNLIKQIEVSNIKKVLFISSTSVYPKLNQIITEKTPVMKTNLSEIELLFKSNSIFETTIIRFGGLFGYDREPSNFVKQGKKIENPEGYVNLIHRDDCIRVIEQIIFQNIWGETLNACADSHPTRRVFYGIQMLKLGKKKPEFDENSPNSYKIINSDRLKLLLGFVFKYSKL